MYTLGRASLQGQLSHLTALRLPDAKSLAQKMSSMPTATGAARALSDAAEQIRRWIGQAGEVLRGLDADDDVAWAAAGGRDGIADVDQAIARFGRLVEVYVVAIERLQTRQDVDALSGAELLGVVQQMEDIIARWARIQEALRRVRAQVEMAVEWEELWNTGLGEVAQEMEGLHRLVFEMEERRHQGVEERHDQAAEDTPRDSFDMTELESMVDDMTTPPPNRRSLLPPAPSTPPAAPPVAPSATTDDSSLLALSARMQPLRVSLDFLPMRIAALVARADVLFPSACRDLELRAEQLEAQWAQLSRAAAALRHELAEDRWIAVFRHAARQALHMCALVEHSLHDLRAALATRSPPATLAPKRDLYLAHKRHHAPAIARVLAIVDAAMAARASLHGELLRLHADARARWAALRAAMCALDADLAAAPAPAPDSRSALPDTRSALPAPRRLSAAAPTTTTTTDPAARPRPAPGSRAPSSSRPPPRARPVSVSVSAAAVAPAIPTPASSSPSSVSSFSSSTPRPRWNGTRRADTHDFPPLSALEPSPYARAKRRVPSAAAAVTAAGGAAGAAGAAAATTPARAPLRRSAGRVASGLPVPVAVRAASTSTLGTGTGTGMGKGVG